jgi:hypothetical protein
VQGSILEHGSIECLCEIFGTKSCRRKAEIVYNLENENVSNIGQGETPHRKHKRLELGGGHLYDHLSV